MQVAPSYVSAMEQCVQSLVESQSPSDIFKVLLTGSQCAAPRAAVFLVRQGSIKGWGSIGYDEDVAKAQRAFRANADSGWLGELIADPEAGLTLRSAGGDPDFGQAAASDAAAIAVRVKGRTIALLTAERAAGESLWIPESLRLLVAVAQLRLELDLALRKLRSGRAPSAAVAEPRAAAVPAEPIAKDETFEPQGEAATAEIDEVPAAEDEQAELTVARRFAKLVATDIRLYNEELVMAGRREGDLAERLADQVARGKETFLRRHGDLGSAAVEILHGAFVEVLAGGDEELLPVSVFE